MAWSPAELRHLSRVLVAHAQRVRAVAEAARQRSLELRTKAEAARASADTHQADADAATDRNAKRKRSSLTKDATRLPATEVSLWDMAADQVEELSGQPWWRKAVIPAARGAPLAGCRPSLHTPPPAPAAPR
jgi:hypothetical protein